MRARAALAVAAMLTGLAAAQAQKIPGGDMAGRERGRFTANPAERLMVDPMPHAAPAVTQPSGKRALKRKKR